jgi:hypothetical protein
VAIGGSRDLDKVFFVERVSPSYKKVGQFVFFDNLLRARKVFGGRWFTQPGCCEIQGALA